MITLFKERWFRPILPFVGAALLGALPQAVQAQDFLVPTSATGSEVSQARTISEQIAKNVGELREFYSQRGNRPLWFSTSGQPLPAAAALLADLRTAQFDGVSARQFKIDRLARLLDRARLGGPAQLAAADVELSRTLAAYVRAMRSAEHEPMIYESGALQPIVPTAKSVLESAARAKSLEDYVSEMRWMHPFYAPLRDALLDPRYSEPQREQIWTNLARVRAIPASLSGRQVLVDAASARLWMYEEGQPVDTMKVVVGKPELQTPMMAGFIRNAVVNPYWNIPEDLVRNTIATNVLASGLGYLKGGNYQVLSDWREDAPLVDPKTIDWKAVLAGTERVHVRQLPGGDNFMGKVKFVFPNERGIYLHDTPAKNLMAHDARQLSSGCVRLEDAARFGRWLMAGPLPTSKVPEQVVALPEPVPVYITYLTAIPDADGQIAFQSDPYTRDSAQFAAATDGAARADRP